MRSEKNWLDNQWSDKRRSANLYSVFKPTLIFRTVKKENCPWSDNSMPIEAIIKKLHSRKYATRQRFTKKRFSIPIGHSGKFFDYP